MKALVLAEINQAVQYQEVPKPAPRQGEVLIDLQFAALNHRDVWIRKGKYAGIQVPIILGSDGSGYLDGKEVLINPSLYWGKQQAFQSAQYQILGLPAQGTFAEFVAVPAANVFAKPAHLSLPEAAALPLAGLTAYRALFQQAKLRKREKVLITGIGGGVASLAMQMALAQGNEVWVTSSQPEKMQIAIERGAKGAINYTNPAWAKELKAQAGSFDVVIDGAGGPQFASLLTVCNPGARIAIYGGTSGNITDLSPQLIFWKQLTIIGSTMGSDRDFGKMLRFVEQYQVKPIIDKVLPLSDGNAAFDHMENGLQNGKIILKIK